MEAKNKIENREMTLTRIINAPHELVWEAWTNAKHIKKWWGPKLFTNPICEWKAEQGNKILIHMQAPDGTIYPMNGVFHKIIKPEQLVFASAALDKTGKILFEVMNTITFTEHKGKTKLIIHAKVSNVTPEAEPYLADMNKGWSSSIDKLEEYLINSNTPFTIERTYNAPIEKVWKAISDKNEMKKWYFDLTEFKTEVGFEFQFWGGPPNKSYLHLCKVTEVIIGKKLTYSWRFDGYPGNSFVTFELFAEGNKTKLKLTHAELESFASSNNPDFDKKNFEKGWAHFVDIALKEFLDK